MIAIFYFLSELFELLMKDLPLTRVSYFLFLWWSVQTGGTCHAAFEAICLEWRSVDF